MKFKITIVTILTCILIISMIPALAECSRCGSGYRCAASQFSHYCKYNCGCHKGSSCSVSPVPSLTPSTSAKPTPSAEIIPNTTVEAEIIRQVNAERAKYGLSQLRTDPVLTQAAYIRAQEIVDSFSHTRPDGSSWRTVSASAKGENIARGYNTADKVMAAWLTSEGHRANILRNGFTSIGVCAVEYNGVMYWVQLFGTN